MPDEPINIEISEMSDEKDPMETGENGIEPETDAVEEEQPSPKELAELRWKAAENDRLMDRIKRITAEYINSQKRMERQMEERCDFAIEAFAREMLVVADDLARAIAAAREHETADAMLDGLHIVEQHLYAIFQRHGITPVETKPGDVFNPEIHEAFSVVKTNDLKPNHIVTEAQKGFRIHKRLLRPTRVAVSAEPDENPNKEA